MDSKIIRLLLFFLLPINSFATDFQGTFKQGSFILGKTTPSSNVFIDKTKVRVSEEGYFTFGIGRDRTNNIIIKILHNGNTEVIEKKILKKKYNIQKIDGLPSKHVTPPPEVYDRIKNDNKLIGEARSIDTPLAFFKEEFIYPLENYVITGVYGSQRILNGKPRWPHYGIDIAAKKGTEIKSSGTGIVTMAETDLYYTGGTVIMDHGHGISTIYSHLASLEVKVGDEIIQGDIIGTVGSTGRSTGPHLDFRVNWFQTRLDPMSILK